MSDDEEVRKRAQNEEQKRKEEDEKIAAFEREMEIRAHKAQADNVKSELELLVQQADNKRSRRSCNIFKSKKADED